MVNNKIVNKMLEILDKKRREDKIYNVCRNLIESESIQRKTVEEFKNDISINRKSIISCQKFIDKLRNQYAQTEKIEERIDNLENYIVNTKNEINNEIKACKMLKSSGFDTIDEVKLYAIELEMKEVEKFINANIENENIKKIFFEMLPENYKKCYKFDKEEFLFRFCSMEPEYRIRLIIKSYVSHLIKETEKQTSYEQIKNYVNSQVDDKDIKLDDEDLEK